MDKKTKTIKAIESKLQERIDQKKALQERIDKAKADVDSARKMMAKAASAEDEASFNKAADRERFNLNVIAANEERLKELENIPYAEAEKTLQEISSLMQSIENDATEKAAGSVGTFFSVAIKAQAEMESLQELAKRYAMEAGNNQTVLPYVMRQSELFGLLNVLKNNKRRIECNGIQCTLYKGVTLKD